MNKIEKKIVKLYNFANNLYEIMAVDDTCPGERQTAIPKIVDQIIAIEQLNMSIPIYKIEMAPPKLEKGKKWPRLK